MAGEARGDGQEPAALTATTVRFDAETWAQVEREARRRGMSKAGLIRDATIRELARAEAAALMRAELRGELAALDELRRRLAVVERTAKFLLLRRR